jgi:hypothetical protein
MKVTNKNACLGSTASSGGFIGGVGSTASSGGFNISEFYLSGLGKSGQLSMRKLQKLRRTAALSGLLLWLPQMHLRPAAILNILVEPLPRRKAAIPISCWISASETTSNSCSSSAS